MTNISNAASSLLSEGATSLESSPDFLAQVDHEDFLPPISRLSYWTGLALVSIVGIAFTLASVIQYKVVIKGQAAVRPQGELRLVQAAVDGTVVSIFAVENQEVKRGDVVARLDDLHLRTQIIKLQESIKSSQYQLINIDLQIQAIEHQIVAEMARREEVVAAASAELDNRRRQYRDNDIAAKVSVEEATANLKSIEATYKAAALKWDRYQPLAQAGAISKEQLEEAKLTVEQQKQATNAALAKLLQAESALNPSHSDIAIATSNIEQERAAGVAVLAALQREQKSLIQQKIQLQNQRVQDERTLQQLNIDLGKTIITATADGIITNLNVRNPGQNLRTGEEIAHIAPSNSGLSVKALVASQDISKVTLGQNVQLRISACPYPDYGTAKGIIRSISPDAIAISEGKTAQTNSLNRAGTINQEGSALYEVNVDLAAHHLQQGQHICHIKPGMEGRADIVAKEESVLRFLLRKARLVADI